jgi:hypothetical protein
VRRPHSVQFLENAERALEGQIGAQGPDRLAGFDGDEDVPTIVQAVGNDPSVMIGMR